RRPGEFLPVFPRRIRARPLHHATAVRFPRVQAGRPVRCAGRTRLTRGARMDFYLGLAQIIGVHTLLGLSAYCVLLTGQVSLAQAGFFAVGAYVAAMLTVLAGWALVPSLLVAAIASGATACAVGFPALRVKGLMLVVATIAFGEAVRLFFFNFT